jgi:hypothetical protein
MILLGSNDAIREKLRLKPNIISDQGIVSALTELISAQAEATPDIVGLPVAVIQVDSDGSIRWLQKGACN